MERYFGLGGVAGSAAAAAIVLMAQPAFAAATQIVGVQVNPTGSGVSVMLQTRNGSRPQVFTVSRGNALVADIINAQLQLPGGKGFTQAAPAPGIHSIAVSQLDANSVRVTVSGSGSAPTGQVSQQQGSIVLNASSSGAAPAAQAQAPAPTAPPALPAAAPAPAPQPAPTAPMLAQAPPPADVPGGSPAPSAVPGNSGNNPSPGSPAAAPAGPTPGVMVPNPNVTIDGTRVPQPTADGSYNPPVQSRAVAPPLGDIAVSSIDTTPTEINLGTQEVVPRLVLRDAPVRDVLSLLARAAGLNVAYVGSAAGADQQGQQGQQQQAQGQQGQQSGPDIRISLDIENEPVQNVFNYVLRVAGLEANRSGRTVFVGPRLPDNARNVIARTLRMNQASVTDAANFLTAQGAETQIPIERVEIQSIGEGAAARTVEIRTPDILALRAQTGNAPLLLRGLSVLTNTRLNTITLVGTPRQVEIAVSMLSQLDLRQRQVAVNVKVVDVNLLATEDVNTSFSFGVGDTFVSSDNGAVSVNFGGVRPPSNSDVTGSRLTPPITAAPFPSGVENLQPFQDAQPNAPYGTGSPQSFGNPSLNDGTIQTPRSIFVRPPFGTRSNPLQGGVTDVQSGTITVGLPQLFQYPTRFLANLQSQVVSGNAKILTDPTLVIQEGQEASVALTQDVITNVTSTFTDTSGGTRQTQTFQITPAGLNLQVLVNRIDDNGFVTLAVNPRVTAPVQTVNAGSGNSITLLATRELKSGQIRLRDGQTLILSGIIQETDRATVTKVPILGDIPILGALFRRTERQNTRQEVIVLLTPRVLDDSDTSTFGYRYTPSRDAQQILRRQGVQVP